jgi:cell division protein FtsW (lipid II flippase)
MSNNNDTTLNNKRDELIFDLIKRRYDGELDTAKNLDSKSGNIVGFVSIVVVLTLGGESVFSTTRLFEGFSLLSNQYATVLYFVGITILLVSIGCALAALKIRRWTVVPNVDILINEYTKLGYSEVLKRNAAEMRHSVSSSEKNNKNKAMFIEFSWYSLLIGLTLIVVSYIVVVKDLGMSSI